MLRSVDLPLPEGPSRTTSSPRAQIEVDAAQRLHLDLAHPVGLHERADAWMATPLALSQAPPARRAT